MRSETYSISVIRTLEDLVDSKLHNCGLFYKLFSRIKREDECKCKIAKKIKEKGDSSYCLEDYVGFRVVLYFKEDIEICESIIASNFNVIGISKDTEDVVNFGPTRINYVCEIESEHAVAIPFDQMPNVRNSFELQIRTVFSEGWHEIEHDLRYKAIDDWDSHKDLSRALNGIYATLETCDWGIASLFNQMAYQQYREKNWEAMLRHKLRMRIVSITERGRTDELMALLNENPDIAKSIFKADRREFLLKMAALKVPMPLTFNNIIYLLNEFQIKNEKISAVTPAMIKSFIPTETLGKE